MERYYRIEADIDLTAIRKNILTMKEFVKRDKKILAVVKANAYGHDVIAVANELYDIVDYFGVACIDEAIELRKKGIDKPILILGLTDNSEFPYLLKYDITQTISSVKDAVALSKVAKQLDKIAKVHIKIDTGMNRIGFSCNQETIKDIIFIKKLDHLHAEGIFTHYYKADEYDKGEAHHQLAEFTKIITRLEQEKVYFDLRHISNSAGIMEMPNDQYDMVRSGISTYGLYPSEEMDKDACILHPTMQLKSHITYLKTVKAGECIGYGGTYTVQQDAIIATVGVGYADGYPRALSNQGRMIVRGQYAPIVGRVCMDQTMIDVTHIKEVQVGDEVLLVGKQGENEISVEEVAELAGSFNYEFVCNVNRRVPRVFYKDGTVIGDRNYLFDSEW